MRRTQTTLTVTLLTTALLVLAILAAIQISGAIDFLYRNVPNLTSIRTVAALGGIVAGALLLLAGFAVAIPAALQPLGFGAKLLAVLPLWLLLFTLAGVVMNSFHLGTVGMIGNFGMILVTFAIAWLAVGSVLSAVAVVIAAATARLGAGSINAGLALARLAGIVALIASVAMIATVVIASGSQPSFGRPPGGGEGGQQRPQGAATQQAAPGVAQTPEVSAAPQRSAAAQTPEVSGAPASTESAAPGGQPGAGNGGNRNNQGGGQPGGQPGGEGGGPPGGPGGFVAAFAGQLRTVGIVVGVLAIVELLSLFAGLRVPRAVLDLSGGYAFGSAVAAFVVVTLIIGAAMQLVQVPHDNPPANGPIQFDSPQTQQLFEGACADCHSNDTKWPWYAYVAPVGWLNSIHVHDARQQMNLSELGAIPAFRRENLGQSIEMQLRSGNMPPADYQLLHPSARLTDEQKEQLIEGLKASLEKTP